MRFANIIRIIETEPWLIKPSAHASISRIVFAHIDGTAHGENGIAGLFEKKDAPKLIHEGNVGVVTINGIIGSGVSAIERSSGVTDVADVDAMLSEAEADDSVDAILLDIDSPGGTVTGVPELADHVHALSKPCVAYTGGQMDSAAYWIGSQADQVLASKSAGVGSVGVYMAVLDQSLNYAMQGYKMDVIRSGIYKGAGVPGTSLTDEQRAHFQSIVATLADQFKAAVLRKKKTVCEASMQGQEFYAPQALQAGLIDGVTNYERAVKNAAMLAQQTKRKGQ